MTKEILTIKKVKRQSKEVYFNFTERRLAELGYLIPQICKFIKIFPSLNNLPKELFLRVQALNSKLENLTAIAVYDSHFPGLTKHYELECHGGAMLTDDYYAVFPLVRDV